MSAIRMLFLMVAALILIGIWLTGFNVVHWFLYIPVAALAFAGIMRRIPDPFVGWGNPYISYFPMPMPRRPQMMVSMLDPWMPGVISSRVGGLRITMVVDERIS